MALITLSGYPCSGKSRRAAQIKDHLEHKLQEPTYAGQNLKVIILSDDSLHIDRSVYNESRAEKPARGTLFTAMQREMGLDTILIIDAPNYIKGFRYQMYCAAREAKLRVCTVRPLLHHDTYSRLTRPKQVYVVATPELSRQWNNTRQDGRAYAPETLVSNGLLLVSTTDRLPDSRTSSCATKSLPPWFAGTRPSLLSYGPKRLPPSQKYGTQSRKESSNLQTWAHRQ